MVLTSHLIKAKATVIPGRSSAAHVHTYLASNTEGLSGKRSVKVCPGWWNRWLWALRRSSSWGHCSKMCCPSFMAITY